jgi:hypothetical protein
MTPETTAILRDLRSARAEIDRHIAELVPQVSETEVAIWVLDALNGNS